jgi:hypothetical protein
VKKSRHAGVLPMFPSYPSSSFTTSSDSPVVHTGSTPCRIRIVSRPDHQLPLSQPHNQNSVHARGTTPAVCQSEYPPVPTLKPVDINHYSHC